MHAVFESEDQLRDLSQKMFLLLLQLHDYLDKAPFDECPPQYAAAAIQEMINEVQLVAMHCGDNHTIH